MASGGDSLTLNEDSQGNMQQNDFLTTKLCDACLYDDTLEQASGFCVPCTEYLCDKCCRDHRKNKITRNHTVLKQDEMPDNVDAFQTINKLSKCAVHEDHEFAYECIDHNAVICVVCLSETHRKCDHVIDLSTCTECDDTHDRNLSENQDKLNYLISKKQRNVEQILNDERRVENEIKAFGTQLKQNIDVLIDELLSELKVNTETATNIEAQGDYRKIQSKIEEGISLLKTANAYGTRHQVTMVNRYVKGLNEQITQEITNGTSKTHLVTLSLKKESSLLETKHIGDVQLISSEECAEACGSDALSNDDDSATFNDSKNETADTVEDVCQSESSKELTNDPKTQRKSDTNFVSKPLRSASTNTDLTSLDNTNVSTPKPDSTCAKSSPQSTLSLEFPKSKPKLQDRFVGKSKMAHMIRTTTDKHKCSASAMKLLLNGNVVLADRSNSKIKLFSSNFVFHDEVKLQDKPIDICIIKGVIYVCCYNAKKIFWYNIVDQKIWPYARSYATLFQPISVSKIDLELLILFSNADFDVVEPGDVNIEIRNQSTIQARISYDALDGDFEYVEDAKRIQRLESTEIILAENDRVSGYNVDINAEKLSKRLWYFKSYGKNKLKDARGITKDSEGNVYVCGRHSNNVHQVSSKNFCMNRVIVSNINAPVSVCVDEKNDRLLVGCDEDNYVHSYSMT